MRRLNNRQAARHRLAAATRLAPLGSLLLLMACSSTQTSGGYLQNRGAVTIDSRRYQSGGQTYGSGTISAAFIREEIDPFFGCKLESFGACSTHRDCQPVILDTPDLAVSGDLGVNSIYASAGTISIGNLAAPIQLMLITMGMFAGQYSVYQQFTPLFKGGENLLVHAIGAEVPAFDGQVTAPAEPTVSALKQNAMLFRNHDLSLSWTGGGAGTLRLSLSTQQPMSSAGFDCVFPAGDGAGTVPTQALELLPAGYATLTLSAVSESLATAGGWQVQLDATTGAVAADGMPLDTLNVILQ
jgi:hypothetical protein